MDDAGEPIRAAEAALEDGAGVRQVLQRFGTEAVRQRRLTGLLRLLEDWDPGWGAAGVGRWVANLVDSGHLVPGGGGE